MEQEQTQLLNTPLYDFHVAVGAKMAPFAGWNMPIQDAGGILSEHHCTRTAVSLFDICHMGEFEVDGPNSPELLDRLLARPVTDQKPGTCRYNFLLNEQGGVLDDLIVYRLDDEGFFIVVNAATKDADAAEFRRGLPFEIEFNDVSAATGKGLEVLPGKVYERLRELPPVAVFTPDYVKPAPHGGREFTVRKEEDGSYFVDAPWLERILGGSNVDDYESLQYFQRQLGESGILDELVKQGVEENDTILIGDYQFDYIF